MKRPPKKTAIFDKATAQPVIGVLPNQTEIVQVMEMPPATEMPVERFYEEIPLAWMKTKRKRDHEMRRKVAGERRQESEEIIAKHDKLLAKQAGETKEAIKALAGLDDTSLQGIGEATARELQARLKAIGASDRDARKLLTLMLSATLADYHAFPGIDAEELQASLFVGLSMEATRICDENINSWRESNDRPST